jgi:hypothetical protein
MALKKDFVIQRQLFDGSLTAKNAYWKITKINGDKNELNVEVTVSLDSETLDKKVFFVAPNLDGKNFIAQAYEHLKTLPEFAGAVDC